MSLRTAHNIVFSPALPGLYFREFINSQICLKIKQPQNAGRNRRRKGIVAGFRPIPIYSPFQIGSRQKSLVTWYGYLCFSFISIPLVIVLYRIVNGECNKHFSAFSPCRRVSLDASFIQRTPEWKEFFFSALSGIYRKLWISWGHTRNMKEYT